MRRLAALGVVVALVGCGGGGGADPETAKARYTREFKAALETTEREGDDFPDLPDDAPLPEQGDQIRQGIVLLRRLGDRLAGIEPPADVERAHTRLVRGIRRIADEATALVRAARANDRARVERLLSPDLRQNFADVGTVRLIAQARAEFDRKSYDVLGPLPGLP